MLTGYVDAQPLLSALHRITHNWAESTIAMQVSNALARIRNCVQGEAEGLTCQRTFEGAVLDVP